MNFYRTVDIDWFKQRLVMVMFCVTAAFAILVARLFFLQVIEGREYRRLSENNCIRLQAIAPTRGLIFDRNGKTLVDNRPAFDLSIIPRDAKNIETTLEKLAAYTGLPLSRMETNFSENRGRNSYNPVVLAQDVGREVLAVVEARKFELPGVVVDFKPRRHYLYDGFAAHLIGYLGEISRKEMESDRFAGYKSGSAVGKCGAEKIYDRLLRGEPGGRQVEVNASGQVVRVLKTVDAHPGNNVYLTIDFALQQKAESLMDKRAGAVVAVDPATGDVLAMASSPSFSQNAFVDGLSGDAWRALVDHPYRPMENKAIQAEYPPASTYKIITAMAGLEEDVIDTETTVTCPGYYRYGNRVFRCWKRGGHGKMRVVDAITQSCDVFFYHVGQNLGVERLAWYAKACGLGRPTGVNLFSEASGLVPTTQWKRKQLGKPWHGGETINVAIGQGYNLVTPTQMAVLIAAVANGGTLRKPVVLEQVRTAEGKSIRRGTADILGTLPASEATLDILQKGLYEVVHDRHGTGWWMVRSGKVDISGKTGTAQVVASPPEGMEDEEEIAEALKPHAWFIAFAPSNAPEIAVSVIVEHGEHGSTAAGPVAKQLIEAYMADRESKTS
ncbi:MAG: penicillin-binding protein 2 [Thermodesulfobacteriota bacterium]|nr:penicillin-binding protein 2 [Thermodesulfobacteriota bacterium]